MVTACLIATAVALLGASVYASEPVLELPHRGCYYPTWAQYHDPKYTPANIDPTLCTYILVAFVNINNNALATREWNDLETFKALTALKSKKSSLKILVSIGGDGALTEQVRGMASTPAGVSAFAASAVKTLRDWGVDGLDVDWEFPTAQEKDAFSNLLKGLRTAFDKEAKDTGKERLILSAALHLPPSVKNEGYDGPAIDKALDIVNIMSYDYAGGWEPNQVGHNAPLLVGPHGTPSPLNTADVMIGWAKLGVSKSKLVYGLPLYGRAWALADPNNHGLDAPAKGIYGDGAMSFTAICQQFIKDKATVTKVFDQKIQASYAYTSTYWIGYDDVQTIKTKAKWAKDNGFGGVMVWDLSQDDFANSCSLGRNPLLSAIRDTLAQPAGATTQQPQTAKPVATTAKPTSGTVKPQAAQTTAKPAGTTAKPVVAASTKPAAAATTAKPAPPSSSEATCDTQFCSKQGNAGLYALGKCSANYCQCASPSAYKQSCGSGLVFNGLIQGCDWKVNVCP